MRFAKSPFAIKKISIDILFSLIFSVIFSAVPWPYIFQKIYGHPMIDRNVYELQIIFSNLRIDYADYDKIVSYFTYEYIWNYVMRSLYSGAGIPINITFWVISFITIFLFCLTIIRKYGYTWTILLVNPLVVDFAFSQLRLALAVSTMLVFHNFVRPKISTNFFASILSGMIHTASLVFISIYAFCKTVSTRADIYRYKYLLILITIGIALSIVLGPAREIILSTVGDRRASYQDMSSSPLYLSFWVFLLLVLCMNWKLLSQKGVEPMYSIVILSFVAINVLTGGYSTRFIAAAFPFILMSIAGLDGVYRYLMVCLFTSYAVLQWSYWLLLV